MFFSKTKTPKNNKIRFQNPRFRSRLKQARGYKRAQVKIPEKPLGIFLARAGLGGWPARIATFLGAVAIIYILYAPNFLTIKTINISGVKDEAAEESIKKTIKNYFNTHPFWPQSNLLLLSKSGLADYLRLKNFQVSRVEKIDKDFFSKLNIEVRQRFDQFLLKNGNATYLLSNDGLISSPLNEEDLNSTTSPYSMLIPFDLAEIQDFYEKQAVAEADYFARINEILNLSESQISERIVNLSTDSFAQTDVVAKTQNGYDIKFDTTFDLPKVFEQIQLLLKDVGSARIKSIKYIDMRVKDRGYACYKDAPCAQEIQIMENSNPTSTPRSDLTPLN